MGRDGILERRLDATQECEVELRAWIRSGNGSEGPARLRRSEFGYALRINQHIIMTRAFVMAHTHELNEPSQRPDEKLRQAVKSTRTLSEPADRTQSSTSLFTHAQAYRPAATSEFAMQPSLGLAAYGCGQATPSPCRLWSVESSVGGGGECGGEYAGDVVME